MSSGKPEALRAADLFAGAGGLTWGFREAGFAVPLAVEADAWAAETYQFNNPEARVIAEDIRNLPDSALKGYSPVDVVMGGPPCQGFSISASNRRNPRDERNLLYRQFLRGVELMNPKAVVLENVKEITKAKVAEGKLLLDDLLARLEDLGYSYDHGVVNAADYGVPQERHRFFLLASRSKKPRLEDVRKTHGQNDLFEERQRYLTLWDAISDLPEVKPFHVTDKAPLQYAKDPQNEYQRKMRRGSTAIYNHVPMRHSKLVVERFHLIPVGGDLTDVPARYGARVKGHLESISGRVYSQNHRRLNPGLPSKTITASFYSSFVHPYQDRNLTVREAARIQGFPDVFVFKGRKTRLSHKLLARKGLKEDIHLDQFNQVGNAVPPPLAEALARYIYSMIS